ncbi:hypothetical protein Dimus_007911, partial [Dionaea muscipula]
GRSGKKLFTKRDLVFKKEYREFYKNLTVSISWKKEVAKSRVIGVNIEFNSMTLATILEIPGNNGLCDYIKKFANDEAILEARRVKSVEMKPFHRLLQIFFMKNLVPHFGKMDVTSFMDLIYMDYLLTKKKAFSVPLNYKKGKDSKRYDYFEETFLTMCQLKRENGVWWLGSGENRRRDDEEMNDEAENAENIDEEHIEKQAEENTDSGSADKFFDAMDDVEDPADVTAPISDVIAPELQMCQFQFLISRRGKQQQESPPWAPLAACWILICSIFKLNLQGLSRGIQDFKSCTRS